MIREALVAVSYTKRSWRYLSKLVPSNLIRNMTSFIRTQDIEKPKISRILKTLSCTGRCVGVY